MPGTYEHGYMSLVDAAAWAGVSPYTLRRWITLGLPKYQAVVGGKVLVKACDIDKFLTRQQVATPDLDAMAEEVLAGLNGDGQGGRG